MIVNLEKGIPIPAIGERVVRDSMAVGVVLEIEDRGAFVRVVVG